MACTIMPFTATWIMWIQRRLAELMTFRTGERQLQPYILNMEVLYNQVTKTAIKELVALILQTFCFALIVFTLCGI